MASKASSTKQLKKKSFPKVDLDVYSKIALNDLIVFSVHYLQERGIAIKVEEVVSICFRLFPHSFSLKNFPRWPDSALVIRRLNDCREKGLLKGNSLEGFELKFKGQKLAERTAKALGLVKPVAAKKKTVVSKPTKSKKLVSVKTKPVSVKKKTASPVKKSLVPVLPSKKNLKKQVVKQKPVEKKKVGQKKIAVKATPVVVKPKLVVKKKPVQKPVVKKVVVKPVPIKVKKSKPKEQVVQMNMELPVKKEVKPIEQPKEQVPVKKQKPVTPSLAKLQTIIQPELIIPAKPAKPVFVPTASKEEKAKAEKIVRMMERSDAYKLYSKNRHRVKIDEFDFRNMLLATMESTSETLVRNISLFKNSAAIHNRQDLIQFLNECESNFANLLKPSAKKATKK